MANKTGPSGDTKGKIQNIRIRETSLEVELYLGYPGDSLAGIVEEVLPELKEAGFPLRREQSTPPPAPPPVKAKVSRLKSHTILRLSALLGTFVLAYKGCDVLLLAAYSPEGSEGLVKSMGEWLRILSPFLSAILGIAASAGVALVTRRR